MASSLSDQTSPKFMGDLEAEERRRVVETARSWLKTPFHHNACLKGVGVDCAQLMVGVFREAGVIDVETPAPYSAQFFLHRSEEKYLNEVEKYAHRIEGPPLPGDICVWKIGRTFSHGAIVTEWPAIIHALSEARMVIEDRADGGRLQDAERLFYSRW